MYMYMDSNDKNNSIYMDNKNKEDIELFMDHIFFVGINEEINS
jgi:hypothetical protein